MADDPILVFAGSGSRRLTAGICGYLGIEPARNETMHFSEGNLFVRVLQNVRGLRTYVVQSTVFPASDNFMELLFWIDALKRASAESVTAIIPYFSYGKGDKKDEPRVSIRARVCADCIEVAGADRVITMDLHAPQIQGFFHVPVDNLYALPVLCERVRAEGARDLVVVSPDAGFVKQARKFAAVLGCSVVIADKVRRDHDEMAEVLEIIGDVESMTALVVDDFTISGGTLAGVAEALKARGAREVYAAVSHGVLSESAPERIASSPIKKLFVTDSVENQPVAPPPNVEVVSVAGLFGEAIKRIHNRESISAMFAG
jgi:ribose-phosphate pyrophosphokinase